MDDLHLHEHLHVEFQGTSGTVVIHEKGKHLIGCKFSESSEFQPPRYASKVYDYWTDDETIEEGDYCVVKAPGGLKVVKVVKVCKDVQSVGHNGLAWIIQKVDLSGSLKRQERAKVIGQLKQRLQEEVSKAKRTVEMAGLVKANPDLQKVLDAFAELGLPLTVGK